MVSTSRLAFFAATIAASLVTSAAHGQAVRTWVSGVGDDANPCSRTAPCKTFAGAISKTFTNGIIDCIDAGAFGAVTITKSITIDCHEQFAGVLAGGTTGIIVNIAAGNANDPLRTVHIRNLRIDGAGAVGSVGTRTGIRGVNILNASAVYIEDTIIQNFANEGVLAQPATNLDLFILNSVIADNNGTGLSVTPAASQTAIVTLNNVHLDRNGIGISVLRPAPGAAVVTLHNTNVDRSTGVGIQSSGANSNVVLNASIAERNGGAGLLSVNGGRLFSFGNNVITGNGAADSPTTAVALQ